MGLLTLGDAAAAETTAPAKADRVQAFLDRATPICVVMPAQACIGAGWAFAATDPKRGLTAADAEAVRQDIEAWYFANQATLDVRTKASAGLGLLLANTLGAARVHAAFDTNRDGFVSQPELLQDVTLDERPLGETLGDPDAVDRAALAARLGLPAAIVDRLFR